jgi:hypothetical protein
MDDTAGSGAYGVSPYGQEAYGGSESVPYTVPVLQVPSDDLSSSHKRRLGRVVHRRYGIPVSSRVAYRQRRWQVRFDAVTEDVINELAVFFEADSFWLLPDGSTTSRIQVMWSEADFEPKRLRGPFWNIEFTIEEVAS